jgi:hypothetical protein
MTVASLLRCRTAAHLFTALAATAAAAQLVALPVLAKPADAEERISVLVIPTQPVGEVRAALVSRVAKSFQDKMQASADLEILTDRSKAEKGNEAAAKAPVQTAAGKQIEGADALRQEATDLAAEGKTGPALAKFKQSIGQYEKAFVELVDFSKLADSYARAGVCAFVLGSTGEATKLWEAGVSLQPTLVIDRRKQPKELLDAFDAVHARLEGMPKVALTIDGPETAGAEVFVDGIKVGPLPATAAELIPGKHFVQLRGETVEPWGSVVAVGKKGGKVKAKVVAVKVPTAEEVRILAYADLTPCAQTGQFHTQACKSLTQRISRQTGAKFVVFSAIRADKFGRLTLQPLVADASHGGVVALPSTELAADLADVGQKLVDVEEAVAGVVKAFPKDKVLSKPAQFYSKK